MKGAKDIDIPLRQKPRTIALLLTAILAGFGIMLLGYRLGSDLLWSVGHTLSMTGGIWLICRSYVIFLWRRFPWEKEPIRHILLEVLGIGILSTVYGFGLHRLEGAIGMNVNIEHLGMEILITLLITYLITGIHEMVYFYLQWIRNFSRSVKLEKDNIEARYETLKAQINPHFLFNSLNSLSALVEDKPDALTFIRHLSGFLRSILGSRDKDLVYLKDELSTLDHYLELQKSRFGEKLRTDLDVPDKFLLYCLPPLALQMVVENCIKHNVISAEHELRIRITVETDALLVENNLRKKTGVDSTGQGLKNIRDRYRHFTTRELRITETEHRFQVRLPLLILEL
ncbi:MAG: histidine kinase [Bacteroidales bacterium]